MEINTEFNIKSKIRLPQYKLLNYFYFHEFLTSDESIFEEKKKQILEYVQNGSFNSLYDYLIILNVVASFPEVFELEKEEFEKWLESIIRIRSIYSGLNEFDRIDNLDPMVKKFKTFCQEYLQEMNKQKQIETVESLFDLFRESKSEFYEKISINNFSDYPLFTPEILPSFLESFENMNNKELNEFFDFLYARNSRIGFVFERDFLKELSKILENKIVNENKKIRRWHLVHLKTHIDKGVQEEVQ